MVAPRELLVQSSITVSARIARGQRQRPPPFSYETCIAEARQIAADITTKEIK